MAFFSILQLSYLGYASMALQKAAFSVVREAARTGDASGPAFRARLFVALSPLASLNRACWVSVMASKYERRVSPNGSKVTIELHYPMPIWVPLAGKIFGEDLKFHPLPGQEMLETLRILQQLGVPFPPLPDPGFRAPRVRWLTYTATMHNEGSHRKAPHEVH